MHNHHNFAWREEHDGEELVVVRKGATPAFPGQKGFIGGSMGDDAVIVQGDACRRRRDASELQRDALYLDRPRRRARDVADGGGRESDTGRPAR